jgi:hypothetical protein
LCFSLFAGDPRDSGLSPFVWAHHGKVVPIVGVCWVDYTIPLTSCGASVVGCVTLIVGMSWSATQWTSCGDLSSSGWSGIGGTWGQFIPLSIKLQSSQAVITAFIEGGFIVNPSVDGPFLEARYHLCSMEFALASGVAVGPSFFQCKLLKPFNPFLPFGEVPGPNVRL